MTLGAKYQSKDGETCHPYFFFPFFKFITEIEFATSLQSHSSSVFKYLHIPIILLRTERFSVQHINNANRQDNTF